MSDLHIEKSSPGASLPAGTQSNAEERLRESELRYHTLFNTIDEGFCIIEFFDGPHGPLSDYVHVEANPAYERHTGIANVIGQKVRDMVPDEADGWVELYRNVLLTGRPIRFERELVATGRYLELSAFRVEPESRRQVAVLFQDVTARKTAQELMQSEAKRLEVLVQQRTAKLQAAIGELEAFSYSVAHDLRSPLRALSGYARALLEDVALSPTGRTYVERIERAATRMDRLTQEVLAYSQLSRSEVQLHSVDLDKLTHELVDEYPDLAAHRAQITIRSPLLPVLGHEPLLAQALANLLRNACKFVREGVTPSVVVRTEEISGEVRIWVEDNGIGIAQEHRNRLFKLFGRIHPDKRFPGTGVGLAIVMKAAERMSGSAGFESEVGAGSRFWLQLQKP